MGKKVAVIIRDKERQYEGLRCSLGLLLEDHEVSMFVLSHEIDISEEYADNMEYIDLMGGARFSDVPGNVEKHGFRKVSLDRAPEVLLQNQVVIPF